MKLEINKRPLLKLLIILLLIISGYLQSFGQYQNIKDRKVPCRIYETSFTDAKPIIDGLGDDDVWDKVGWTGDFTQSIPKDGEAPSQKTQFKILYDKENLYFLVRAFDTEPEKIVNLITRHDQVGEQRRHNCDDIEIFVSTDGDVSTIVNFSLSVSGSRSDYYIRNYGRSWDVTYNPIWEGKTSVDSLGWIGEVRIPINQFSYAKSDSAYTWGLLVRRTIFRLQEESLWQWIPANSPGWAHLVGELHGVKDLDKKRHFELVPYVSTKSTISQVDPTNPFSKAVKTKFNAGLDGKLSLSSNMTMDLSVNPDFGQVESDPSVINLTAFENFFEEKRPFFLEGKDIFEYSFGENKLFYSRRIGQRPTPYVALIDNFVLPESSPIIDAVKVTGKTKDGLSVGIMQSTTALAKADLQDYDYIRKTDICPLTNYFVARVRKDYNQGQTKVGGFVSSVNMIQPDKIIRERNNEHGYVGGIDFLHKWKDKIYYVEFNSVASYLKGDRHGIQSVKENPVHFYNRFDNQFLDHEDTTTYLSGHGGRLAVGKLGTWQFTESVEYCSPGLDLNDVGFQTVAEYVKQNTIFGFESFKQVGIFRDLFVTMDQENNWDYYLDTHLVSRVTLQGRGRFMNNYQFNLLLRRNSKNFDIRQLRGGPGLLNEGLYRTDVNLSTDARKKIIFSLFNRYDWSDDKISELWNICPGIELKISSNIKLQADIGYTLDVYDMQYAGTAAGNEKEFASILAHMKNEIWQSTIRVSYTITPDISVQYYANWLESNAVYSKFRSVSPVNNGAENYYDRFIDIENLITYSPDLDTYSYLDPQFNYSVMFANPDFYTNLFKANLVFRWEYRPNSTLFVVWSQDYSKNDAYGNLERYVGYDINFKNYILVKLSYLFNR